VVAVGLVIPRERLGVGKGDCALVIANRVTNSFSNRIYYSNRIYS